jgi:signal transduction histidine kinase/ActR/RegA family two-component response regulator
MSLEDHRAERTWNQPEIELLRTMAEMVGAQIARMKTEDELRQRGAQMRELLRRERHATMQLEAAMNELLAQQEELRVFNKELRESRVAAEAASQAKSEFLSNMSHEIRTPLTAILGWAEVLGTTGLECGWPEDSVQAVHTIQRNGEHLLEVINGILDLSKIEAGKFQLELARCSPRAVVEEVAALMQVRAKAKGLTLETTYDPPIPAMIRTDPTRLRQVLINLVGNAIKFTETGYVRVVTRLVKQSGDQPAIQFDVIDTGIGMNAEQINRLFRAFTQVDNSTTRPYQGTGLGLAISKRLTELMGGKILVESEPARGSTFRVTISTGLMNEFEPEIPPEASVSTHSPPGEAKTSYSSNEPLRARVLLAEDGPDNQRLIAFVLRKAGAEVAVAGNGRLAVAKVLEGIHVGSPFDVVLMDMQMPEMDGYAATAMLRREGINVPVVALTAHAMSGDREKCLAAGCSDYLTKPIGRAKLIEVIRREMAKSASVAV